MNLTLQHENMQQAALDICHQIELRRRNLGDARDEHQAISRIGPLLALCKQAELGLHESQRPHGTLDALGITWTGPKGKQSPWQDLFNALEHVRKEDGLNILNLIHGSPSASKSPTLMQKVRQIVLNRPAWRIQAIESYPRLFASKSEKLQAERAKADQAPLQSTGPEAPGRWSQGHNIKLPPLETAAFGSNAFVTWATTISMEERSDAEGLQASRELVKALKAAGAAFPVEVSSGNTPIHAGASVSMPARLQALCEAFPALVDRLNRRGRTALHEAIIANSPYAVKALLEGGCDPTRWNHEGQRPLELAVAQRNANIASILLGDERVISDPRCLKRARSWIVGNIPPEEFIAKPKDHEVLALLQATEAKLNLTRIIRSAQAHHAKAAP